jgi:predicted phosphodiesterase
MRQRTIIISDTHLGRGRGAAISASALRPIWQGFERLIINGDVAEIHHPHHRAAAAREVIKLQDLCENDAVELTLLSGNHDAYLTDSRHLWLADGQVFITHGDALHPAVAPWSPNAAIVRRAHDEAAARLAADERDSLEQRLSVMQHAAHAEWAQLGELAGKSSIFAMLIRPWAIAQVLQYWHIAPKLASMFVKAHAPEARFVVLGHTHRPGIWTLDGRTIINTGSFGFPGSPRAVTIAGDRLAVQDIRKARGAYELAANALAAFDLAAQTQLQPDAARRWAA